MNVATLHTPTVGSALRRVGWALLLLGALFAAANAVVFMTVDAHGSPDIKHRFLAAPLAGWAHTMGGAVAALLGPFQLLSRLRAAVPRVHVWTGRSNNKLSGAIVWGCGPSGTSISKPSFSFR